MHYGDPQIGHLILRVHYVVSPYAIINRYQLILQ